MSEDNFIGKAIWSLNKYHKMTSDLALQSLGSTSSINFFKRRARWGRIRKYAVPPAFIIEPFTESLLLCIGLSYSLQYLFNIDFYTTALSFICFWVSLDVLILAILSPELVFSLGFWCAYIVREVTALPVFLWALFGDVVEWRGKMYVLNSDGTVREKEVGIDGEETVFLNGRRVSSEE